MPEIVCQKPKKLSYCAGIVIPPGSIRFLANSPGRMSLIVWKPSREDIADEAVEDSPRYEVPRHEMTPA